LATYLRGGMNKDTPAPPPGAAGHRFSEDRLEIFKPVLLEDRRIGTVYLHSDLSELQEFFRRSAIALVWMVVFISLITYVFSSILQRVISTPLTHLADTARGVSWKRDYSLRADKTTEDELGELTDAFNSMLHQIEERDQALRSLRNMLRNIIDSMPSVLVGVDPDGKVTQWNMQAETFTGITAANARGRSLTEVFPRLSSQMNQVSQAIRERQPQKNTKIPIKTEDEIRYSDITVYPLIADGLEGAVIRIDDVTDQVRIEEMMIQSEKMLSVGGLAAGMAHEINNPLAGILQNIQVMRNRLTDNIAKNEKTAREVGASIDIIARYMEKRGILPMIDAVMESGRRAARIVNNMLSFSRKSDSKFASWDLAKLLDKTVELASNDYDLSKKYDFRRIEIVRCYDPGMPKVYCEKTKIQQVILNLLKNGAEAMNEKPGDAPHRFILRVGKDDYHARLEIEDNGPGIDELTRKRIFEPFFTTKEVGLGTGLGLSVSYFIITENHGGTMNVESSPGKGTNFIIHLPFKGEAA
jgi:PAS domain S-box-containing protein